MIRTARDASSRTGRDQSRGCGGRRPSRQGRPSRVAAPAARPRGDRYRHSLPVGGTAAGADRHRRVGHSRCQANGLRAGAGASAPRRRRATRRIAAASGRGSSAERVRLLHDLLRRATAGEQDFLIRLLFGELRQGALEAVLAEAVARAANVPAEIIRRAVMMAGALAPVARAALAGGDRSWRASTSSSSGRCSRCWPRPRPTSTRPSRTSMAMWRSNGSSMARAFRSTRPATRSRCSRAISAR